MKIYLKNEEIIYEGYVSKYSSSMSNNKEICLKDVIKHDYKTGEKLSHDISEIYLQIRNDEDVVIEITS